MIDLFELLDLLEASIKKNGKDYPLTLGHLYNILKKVADDHDKHEEYLDHFLHEDLF